VTTRNDDGVKFSFFDVDTLASVAAAVNVSCSKSRNCMAVAVFFSVYYFMLAFSFC
jgi:hypothetical protein